MATKLLPNHPLAKKVDMLFNFLEENNLTIESTPYGRGILFTDELSNISVYIQDNESGEGIDFLPAAFEFRLRKQEE